MPHLVSTNQLTATAFTPANRRLPGEASSIGRLPRDELKLIYRQHESVATRVDNVYGRCGGSSLEGAGNRGYRKEPSSGKQQVAWWAGQNFSIWKRACQHADGLRQDACILASTRRHQRILLELKVCQLAGYNWHATYNEFLLFTNFSGLRLAQITRRFSWNYQRATKTTLHDLYAVHTVPWALAYPWDVAFSATPYFFLRAIIATGKK